MYSVSNVNGQEQVNFQVPFEVAGRSTAAMIVTRDGQASASVDVPVAAVQPGVYTTDGSQAIVVHNADYTLVTAARPLDRNEYAFLYVSGLGAVAKAGGWQGGGSVADVRVTLGGLPCEVQFAGMAPGFPGVYQVNFRVPSGARLAGSQDIVVAANGVASPAVRANVR